MNVCGPDFDVECDATQGLPSRAKTIRRIRLAFGMLLGAFAIALISATGGHVGIPDRDGVRSDIAAAQPLPPTPAATPGATVAPAPDISGVWSVTRTWFRSCPRCGGAINRTTTWKIQMAPDGTVRIDRGPVGSIFGDGSGGGWLNLEGLESQADSVYRFFYSSLWVHPGGSLFEGGFSGSERTTNPCGSSPPIVTCFASAGYLTALRIATFTPVPGSIPTPGPSPSPGPSPTGGSGTPGSSSTPGSPGTPGTPALPPPPGSTNTPVPTSVESPTATETATPTATAFPATDTPVADVVGRIWLPAVERSGATGAP